MALILAALPIWSGCRQSEPVYLKPSGEPVNLINNSAARDHPWQVVLDFLKRDTTDQEYYTPNRGSAYFAEMLHNRAEYYGFKTAFVVVEFENGETHALNAFNTVDYGLVYIDCTGIGAWDRAVPPDIVIELLPESEEGHSTEEYLECFQSCRCITVEFPYPPHTSWDKVAFVKEGEKLGFVGADCVTFKIAPFDYISYQLVKSDYESKLVSWDDVRKMVVSYIEKSQAGNFDVEECEDIHMAQRRLTLAHLERLVPCYHWEESDTVVTAITVYW